MDAEQVRICLELSEHHRRQAAELYFEAFQRKLAALVGSKEQGITLAEKLFDTQYAIVALHQNQCTGIAGLHYNGHGFIHPQISAFMREFGWLRGTVSWLAFRAFSAPGRKDACRIECLAVSAVMRGKGIGTRLLSAVYDLAKVKGCSMVSLEVVDTNPDARRLYERCDFIATRTKHYPYLRRLAGFSSVTEMVRRVI